MPFFCSQWICGASGVHLHHSRCIIFFSEQLCQDPLEKFFGSQRQWGKSHENPNVQQFCSNSQALRVINGTCVNVSKSNCRGNKATIDWEQENLPLPKRHRRKLTDEQRQTKLTGTATMPYKDAKPANTTTAPSQDTKLSNTATVSCKDTKPANTATALSQDTKPAYIHL